ncbi:hypothetical protein ACTXT7_014742, partial [Hymenolepis weldensis]
MKRYIFERVLTLEGIKKVKELPLIIQKGPERKLIEEIGITNQIRTIDIVIMASKVIEDGTVIGLTQDVENIPIFMEEKGKDSKDTRGAKK